MTYDNNYQIPWDSSLSAIDSWWGFSNVGLVNGLLKA